MKADDEILTIEEVAKYLKLKPQTIYKWAQEGRIPGTKLGKEWRFRKRIIDEWIDASILLSDGGFDLLMRGSMVEHRRSGMSDEDVDRLLDECSGDRPGD